MQRACRAPLASSTGALTAPSTSACHGPVRHRTLLALAVASGTSTIASGAAADQTLIFDGQVMDGGLDHEFIEFAVPAAVAEIEVRHDDLSDEDILDWGLDGPMGFRGGGGGNTEPAVVSADAASRSYIAGPITPGTWRVVIGKAKLVGGAASYHVEIDLRDVATLAPQPERTPYADAEPLSAEARWYAGDFHVHSRESGDARPPIDEIATFARMQGLDFVELSDHNTNSQLDFLVDAQSRHPSLLLLPGVEYTTYSGHANGVGSTAFVDHKLGQPGVTIEAAADAFRAQGALFSVNHPALDLGDLCIGCAWALDLPADRIDAVEVVTAGTVEIFSDPSVAFWETLADAGARPAPIGGSDDHKAGVDLGAFGTPIGTPATMVFAEGLSRAAILEGIRQGKTVVKARGPSGPMITYDQYGELAPGITRVTATVTGGAGLSARWVHGGEPLAEVAVTSDPFELPLDIAPPQEGFDRYRLEVLEGIVRVSIAGHVWVPAQEPTIPAPIGGTAPAGGGCAAAGRSTSGLGAAALAVCAALVARRRRRAKVTSAR